jgi:hypothetical protein
MVYLSAVRETHCQLLKNIVQEGKIHPLKEKPCLLEEQELAQSFGQNSHIPDTLLPKDEDPMREEQQVLVEPHDVRQP